jgi:L-aminopeptidase/D-esterase-like protein
MHDAITDVAGIEVGHAEDLATLTGCTVALCREGAVVGVDVRGLAPGTRETDLCRPGTLVDEAQAVLLTGGSAFGLEAAGGVMRFLWERGIGFDAGVAKVPIVPAAVIFDLGLGEIVWPDADMGYRACLNAHCGEVAQGCVGVGTGASVGKALGGAQATKSGLGTASQRVGEATVAALVVVNAFGNVMLPETDIVLAGARDPRTGQFVDVPAALQERVRELKPGTNTTIGVVATDADLDSAAANHLASAAHDGLARSIRPVHTLLDGDVFFSLATGTVRLPRELVVPLAAATVEVVERSVVRAVQWATPAGGLPAGGS